MKIKRLVLGLALGVVLPSSMLVAQSATPSTLEFEFSIMAWERMRDVGYAQLKAEARSKPRLIAEDFEIIPMRVSSQERSDLYHYEGPMPVRLVATSSEGKSLRATRMIGAISELRIPQRAMLLLGPAEEGAVNIKLLDDSPAAFPGQHVRIVNLAGELVQGTLDVQAFRVDATRAVLPPKWVSESVRVGVAYEKQGRPIIIFDQSLRIGSEERIMLVFLPPFRAGADVRVRVVRDQIFVPAEP